MLRIRERFGRNFSGESRDLRASARIDLPGPSREIVPVFDDPVLELTRLLREAANIEHALLVQYLFAAFSVKSTYAPLAGGVFESTSTLIGVAVQEMRHFARVNELLVALKGKPSLDREDFPIRSDIYPFALELEPLTRASLAKYVTAESPVGALDPATAPTAEERRFREAVAAEVGEEVVNHIGSLYGTIISCLRRAVAANPHLLPNADALIEQLEAIRGEGEHEHFQFFRSVFEGTHSAFGGVDVWADPSADAYPSLPFSKNPSAFEGSPRAILDPLSRQFAWLSNLHYWTILALIDLGYSMLADDPQQAADLIGRSQSHMIGCLYPLGALLAGRRVGLPFDPIALNFGSGPDRDSSRAWLRRLIGELQTWEAKLAPMLPGNYSRSAAVITLRKLGGP